MPETMSPAGREDAGDEALLDALETLPRPAPETRIRVYDQITRRHQDAIVRLVARDMGDALGRRFESCRGVQCLSPVETREEPFHVPMHTALTASAFACPDRGRGQTLRRRDEESTM
ncbi:hypothetical protein [Streptomyces sp. CdTB01]|uniref:hypothetical protein n=1 Tax=Streptomyces sp. CdTB01 TaxID=1725411 RepID=UPI00073AA053|nr:hypothetical protein [Streptomyces sp. CdTB01]ALV30780.1 hypothetical protein AS200_00725 [Streptomyces sp. CdTB01]